MSPPWSWRTELGPRNVLFTSALFFFFWCCDQTTEKKWHRREGLFWVTVFQEWLQHGEACTHRRMRWLVRCIGGQEAGIRWGKGLGCKISRPCSNWTIFSNEAPSLNGFTTLTKSISITIWGWDIQTHEPMGTIPHSNYNSVNNTFYYKLPYWSLFPPISHFQTCKHGHTRFNLMKIRNK